MTLQFVFGQTQILTQFAPSATTNIVKLFNGVIVHFTAILKPLKTLVCVCVFIDAKSG